MELHLSGVFASFCSLSQIYFIAFFLVDTASLTTTTPGPLTTAPINTVQSSVFQAFFLTKPLFLCIHDGPGCSHPQPICAVLPRNSTSCSLISTPIGPRSFQVHRDNTIASLDLFYDSSCSRGAPESSSLRNLGPDECRDTSSDVSQMLLTFTEL